MKQEFPNIRFHIFAADASSAVDGDIIDIVVSMNTINLTVLINHAAGG